MPDLIEEAKAYARDHVVGCWSCSLRADADCITASAQADFLKGVEWTLHKIAGPGRCIYSERVGELGFVCGRLPESVWHKPGASTSHEFQP